MWYPVVDRFRTKYYEVIVDLAREIQTTRKYLNASNELIYYFN